MSKDRSELSPEARRLIELTTGEWGKIRDDLDLTVILQQNPELLKGLGEYVRWRDSEKEAAAKQDAKHPVAHEINEAIKKLPPRK